VTKHHKKHDKKGKTPARPIEAIEVPAPIPEVVWPIEEVIEIVSAPEVVVAPPVISPVEPSKPICEDSVEFEEEEHQSFVEQRRRNLLDNSSLFMDIVILSILFMGAIFAVTKFVSWLRS
jgi:hypothetical protein